MKNRKTFKFLSGLLCLCMVLQAVPLAVLASSDCDHSFYFEYYHAEADGHYLKCDYCSFYDVDSFEEHINDDNNDYCDYCDYTVGHEHTYDTGYYHAEEAGHYKECDQCSFYDIASFEEHINDNNNDYCDYCEYFVGHKHTFDNGNYRAEKAGHYTVCDQCDFYDEASFEKHINDDNDDYCDFCGHFVGHKHTFDHNYYTVAETGHYSRCDQCDVYDVASFEEHINDDNDDACDYCDYTVGHEHTYDTGYYHTEETGHYKECDQCYFYDVTSFDEHINEDNDAACDICGFFVAHKHTYNSGYYVATEAGHYSRCDQCELYDAASFKEHINANNDDYCDTCNYFVVHEHTYNSGYYIATETGHYLCCDQCYFYEESSFATHVNDDNNDYCDTCSCFVAHMHTYNSGYYVATEAGHYSCCDQCYFYDAASFSTHIDVNSDDVCDICNYFDGHEHTYNSGYYVATETGHYLCCDQCYFYEESSFATHVNDDNNDYCDTCFYFVMHEHTYESDSYITIETGHYLRCDQCYFYDVTSFDEHINEDNDAACDICGFFVAHKHTYNSGYYVATEAGHYSRCDQCELYDAASFKEHINANNDDYCDTCNYFVVHEHTYNSGYYIATKTGHYLRCDQCYFQVADSFTAHINDNNDNSCDVCSYFVAHKHTYNSGYYVTTETGHYLCCDQCRFYEESSFAAHIDVNDDDYCDACRRFVTHGHIPGEIVIENEVNATCQTNGSYDEVSYCATCGVEVSRNTVTVAALGHTPGETVIENEVKATCQTGGSYDEVSYCATCGVEVSRNTVTVAALGHTPGEIVIENEVKATCQTGGYYDEINCCTTCHAELSRKTVTVAIQDHNYENGYCTGCGVNKENAPSQKLKLSGAGLTLSDGILLNVKMKKALIDECGYTDVYLKVVLNGKIYFVSEYRADGSNYVFDFTELTPAMLGDSMQISLHAKYQGVEYATGITPYSVWQYCKGQLDKSTTKAILKTMLVDMLNYGSAAQKYVNYKINDLVSNKMTAAQKALGTQIDTTAVNELAQANDNAAPEVLWKGGKLLLGERVTVVVNVQADSLEDLTIVMTTSYGQKFTYTEKDLAPISGYTNRYTLMVGDLGVGQMRDKATFVAYQNGKQVSKTLTYSIQSYVASNGSGISDLAVLLRAMLRYGDSAKAYAVS